MRFEDEIECINKRRSSRIIALEEKKQLQRERELEMALERKNGPINHDIKNKGKGKTTMEICDELCNINEGEEGTFKKRHKNKELYQLISSIQDLEELFAEPINPDVVKNYYEIIKQPMDFATMRAKLHENMYTNLDLFKHDILLLCSNAKIVNPKTSIYHEVAEDISRNAKCIFEALSVVSHHINLEFSNYKRRPGRKPKNGQQKTSESDSPKLGGRQNVAYFMEVEKRGMYKPTSNLLVSEVLCANKPNFQVNENQVNYRESLLQFVKRMGPIAQTVAAKKFEPLQHQQFCIGNTSTQNLLGNASSSQISHQPTPHIPTQQESLNAQKRLTIPDSATQKNNIIDKTRNFRGISKGKMDSSIENVSSTVGSIQEEINRVHLGANKTSNTREWNTSTGIPYMLANGSSTSTNNVFAPHHPTSIISRPQPRLSRNRSSLSGLPLMPSSWLEDTMSCMRNNIIESSLVHQPWKTNAMFSMIPSRVTPWSQPMQGGSISSKNLSRLTIFLPSIASNFFNDSNTSLHGLGTPSQQISFQALLNSPDFNNSNYTMQANLGQVTHQAAPYTPLATQGFPNMQMQLKQESIPLQIPNPLSSSSLQQTSHLLKDNKEKQLNLDLHL
ncbi:unnamed protein product [Sphenostylis stenocarpa]|uniref:Bromo domain-containing protein n=1 Tax=Sphenostylis stenocarpa TaxID=92480 RepID=A0AA86T229_9FABA|nr:unnamed protein product [Sphenostylis stenocarpa]